MLLDAIRCGYVKDKSGLWLAVVFVFSTKESNGSYYVDNTDVAKSLLCKHVLLYAAICKRFMNFEYIISLSFHTIFCVECRF